MGASVRKCPERAVAAPRNDERLAEQTSGQVVAGCRQPLFARGHDPIAHEEALFFELKNLGRGVDVPRRVTCAVERLADSFEIPPGGLIFFGLLHLVTLDNRVRSTSDQGLCPQPAPRVWRMIAAPALVALEGVEQRSQVSHRLAVRCE